MLLREKMEPGPRGASNFSKWGQADDDRRATSCMTAVRPLASEKVRKPKVLIDLVPALNHTLQRQVEILPIQLSDPL